MRGSWMREAYNLRARTRALVNFSLHVPAARRGTPRPTEKYQRRNSMFSVGGGQKLFLEHACVCV